MFGLVALLTKEVVEDQGGEGVWRIKMERKGDVEKDVVELGQTQDHIVVGVETPAGDEVDQDGGEREEHTHVGDGED